MGQAPLLHTFLCCHGVAQVDGELADVEEGVLVGHASVQSQQPVRVRCMKLMRGRVLGEVNLQFLTYLIYICRRKHPSQSCYLQNSWCPVLPKRSSKLPPDTRVFPLRAGLSRNQEPVTSAADLSSAWSCSRSPAALEKGLQRRGKGLTGRPGTQEGESCSMNNLGIR